MAVRDDRRAGCDDGISVGRKSMGSQLDVLHDSGEPPPSPLPPPLQLLLWSRSPFDVPAIVVVTDLDGECGSTASRRGIVPSSLSIMARRNDDVSTAEFGLPTMNSIAGAESACERWVER